MALTTQQMLYINNLLYSTSPSLYGDAPQTTFEGRTIGDFVNQISASANVTKTCSEAEWNSIVDQIKNDSQLMNLQIKNTYIDHSTGDAGCMIVDPSSNEAIVAFRGTGSGEWKDNFYAGTTMDNCGSDPTISVQQQKAIDYVNSLALSGYDNVTVTGHSKGGNKAKICALMCSEVDNCVSFDGQGFSDEFMVAHQAEIARNQSKIHNHNVDGDFVNILLNDVGDTTYYEGQRIGSNFLKNHDPSSFWTADGRMVEGVQRQEMKDLDAFLNSCLRSVDAQKKEKLLDFCAEVANGVFSGGDPVKNLRSVLLDPRYEDQAAYLIAYTLSYENETGKISSSVAKVLENMGLSEFTKYTDIANAVMSNEKLFSVITWAMQHGDAIPDWVIDWVREKLNLDLSTEELRNVLAIVTKAGIMIESIDIDAGSGSDIAVSGSSSGIEDIHQVEIDGFGDIDFDMDFILVDFGALFNAYNAMNHALEQYSYALKLLKNTAENLAGRWEGDGRDAFYENQMRLLQYYGIMRDVCGKITNQLNESRQQYKGAVDRLKQMMM